jgi:demethylmenaquinone methyltransferase/2-methoxy-6-polyprenyl-1,4-benzoquinol methylase
MQKLTSQTQCRQSSESKTESVAGMSSSMNSNPVGQMFDRIAPVYDILNHLLSFGRDFSWRRRLADSVVKDKKLRVLDLATGTGDVLISLLKRNSNVTEAVGLDISEDMLALCRRKITRRKLSDRIKLICANALATGLDDESFDAVTIGFGIRNTPDAFKTLTEIRRSLKKGGTALILEFSMPANRILRGLYLFYLRFFVPLIGRLLSGDNHAYRYLDTSIENFHRPDDFRRLMQKAGFSNVDATPLTFGVACLYQGTRPNEFSD